MNTVKLSLLALLRHEFELSPCLWLNFGDGLLLLCEQFFPGGLLHRQACVHATPGSRCTAPRFICANFAALAPNKTNLRSVFVVITRSQMAIRGVGCSSSEKIT